MSTPVNMMDHSQLLNCMAVDESNPALATELAKRLRQKRIPEKEIIQFLKKFINIILRLNATDLDLISENEKSKRLGQQYWFIRGQLYSILNGQLVLFIG